MSLFQFKVSSLTRQKDRAVNGFENSPQATSNVLGSFSKVAEELEHETSQFFIDESDLWNDDNDKDVFEVGKNNRLKEGKAVTNIQELTSLKEPVIKSVEESEDSIESYKFDISENSEYQNRSVSGYKTKQDTKNFEFTESNYQNPDEKEVCFDLVDDIDEAVLPDSAEWKRDSSKSPTFNISYKVNKKISYSKKDDSDNNSDVQVNKSERCAEVQNSLSASKEQVNPPGLGRGTGLWLSEILQNEAFSIISAETTEEKLQNNLTFLNKTYVEILEKAMSAFESLPLELLAQLPEFDPDVFITLRTTRRRIKAIIIKTENLLKRKNTCVENKDWEEKKTFSSQMESPVIGDFSRLKYSSACVNGDVSGNKFSEGVFTFKHPLNNINTLVEENQSSFASPQTSESKIMLDLKQTKLNFPVLDRRKFNTVRISDGVAADPLKSNTPLLCSDTKTNSDIIDLTDVLYKTPTKGSQSSFGRFSTNLRNNGTNGEFDGMNFPHTKELLDKFRQKFGLRTFRPNQLQVVNAALLGHDCFVLMPTGGGKSLCYQLPAIVSKGVTVVVSPLRSLILDQVTKLLTLDIPAAHLSGDLTESEAGAVYKKLNQPEPRVKLLYVTPEKIGASTSLRNCLLGLYKRQMLARFVIDEAHCVSQWGHDFRPDYKKLRELRENYPNVNIMALTATATPRVRTDILHQLKVANPKWFLSSFNRSNLVYSVREKRGKSTVKEIATLIQNRFKKDTGVIYCFSRKECEDVAKSLKEYGITAIAYHAGLTDNERTRAQNLWMNDKVKVVCATVAFGMGIDKLDVRFVIHFSLPKSIEGYYQESGRAGRDGEKATCILFYCYRDRIRMLKLINMDQSIKNQAAKKVHLDNLFRVAAFAENKTDCRRALQLEYFGEKFDRKNCIENRDTACDNCLNQGVYETIDVTEESKAIVASVRNACGTDDKRNSNFTMLHFVDVFKGTVLKKVLSEGHDSLPSYGMGKSWLRLDVERLFRKLIMEEFIKERLMIKDDGIAFAYLKFGPRGEELLKGNVRIMFEIKKPKGSTSTQSVVKTEKRVEPAVLEIQEKCYSDLMDAIHEIASSVNCNPNAIMNVQALRSMSNSLPETAEEMLSINHVTMANFEKYGNVLLEITKMYAEQRKLLRVKEVPEHTLRDDPWPQRNSEDSPYFETEVTYIGKGKGGKKRKRSNNTRKFQSSKKWKGGSSGSSKATSSKSRAARSGGNGSGVTTVPGAKVSALMELPTNKSRGFSRPKVILKNL